jgi:hypothetical protein
VLDHDDMAPTAMSTFTTLTIFCARCHNHKFDPISQREYYKRAERVEPGSLSCVQSLGAALAISNPSDESSRRAALAGSPRYEM